MSQDGHTDDPRACFFPNDRQDKQLRVPASMSPKGLASVEAERMCPNSANNHNQRSRTNPLGCTLDVEASRRHTAGDRCAGPERQNRTASKHEAISSNLSAAGAEKARRCNESRPRQEPRAGRAKASGRPDYERKEERKSGSKRPSRHPRRAKANTPLPREAPMQREKLHTRGRASNPRAVIKLRHLRLSVVPAPPDHAAPHPQERCRWR